MLPSGVFERNPNRPGTIMLRASALGMLHMVASSQRWALLAASWPMPATPWIWVLTRVLMAEIAMNAANAATTARRTIPAVSLFAIVPSPANAWYATNAATTRLKMAPMSKASITPKPTAKPARATLTQRLGEVSSASAASARKSQPKLKGWDATPQQAVEKKSEFKAAARSEEHTSELQSLRHLVCRL